MRPLYVDARKATRIALDGPALRVDSPERAAGRYPLRLLSRVVASGHATWDTAALLACLHAGIPVSFLDAEGQLIGVAFGANVSGLTLDDRLRDFADRPDWPDHYELWQRAAERRAILALCNDSGIRLADLRPRSARRAVAARLAELAAPDAARRVCGYLESVATAMGMELARDSGIPPGLLVHEGRGIHVLRDMGRLLAWDARTLALRLLARCAGNAPERAALATSMEARRPRLHRLFREYLALLESQACSLNYGGDH